MRSPAGAWTPFSAGWVAVIVGWETVQVGGVLEQLTVAVAAVEGSVQGAVLGNWICSAAVPVKPRFTPGNVAPPFATWTVVTSVPLS